MTERKNIRAVICLIIVTGLLTSSLTAVILSKHYNVLQFHTISSICQAIVTSHPEAEAIVMSGVKEYMTNAEAIENQDYLVQYGYHQDSFAFSDTKKIVIYSFLAFCVGSLLLIILLVIQNRRKCTRIQELVHYLEKVNRNETGTIVQMEDDDFSSLQDEIYKTVTNLRQTKDAAVKAKISFSESLANIAHQLKTPITAISLRIQLSEEAEQKANGVQIKKQLARLSYLEESLLLLSRIDAGVLQLDKTEVDLFTALTLASESLEELLRKTNVSVEIPEGEVISIIGDLDWTMEALLNLIKNCAEHSRAGGTIHCRYERNPLYTRVRIWDEGDGFAREDIPHLFERFYRGKEAKPGSIGIGLALAKSIFEMENGLITAENIPGGGAMFEIRFYSHQDVTLFCYDGTS